MRQCVAVNYDLLRDFCRSTQGVGPALTVNEIVWLLSEVGRPLLGNMAKVGVKLNQVKHVASETWLYQQGIGL